MRRFATLACLMISLAHQGSAAERLLNQTAEDELRKSSGCTSSGCHVRIEPMHLSAALHIGCTDCHGGRADTTDKLTAHIAPKNPSEWPTTANPPRQYARLNQERYEFIKFVNPGDLRVAEETCGSSDCHRAIVYKNQHSLMTHGAFLWGAALYNNGASSSKDSQFGESYDRNGKPRALYTVPPPTAAETLLRGILPVLKPLPEYEFTQPGNTLRVFERGEERLSPRGFGTLTRTDPVFQGLQRTRLLDPLLSFLGTNDEPGDYRSSGCSACHVVYANDRDPVQSGPYASAGHLGHGQSADPTIPKNESGHPILHQFTRRIPTSQCVVCHVHPGTSYASQYTGYMWWDNETDGGVMYPEKDKKLTPEESAKSLARNPESASLKGNWSNPNFLQNLRDINPKLKQTQFADYNGHGWVYRAVYKHDRKGTWLDKDDKPVDFNDPKKFEKAVHLKDIHLEKGMHCIDCHGSVRSLASLKASGTGATSPQHDLSLLRTPFGSRRFEWVEDKLMQRSMVDADKQWEVSQVKYTVTPGNPKYNQRAAYAKTIQKDNQTWGSVTADQAILAHQDDRMSCYSCHTSWMTSCFGCHLSMRANAQRPNLHFEADQETRNYTTYNYEVLRDDVFMLGLDSTAKKNRIAPVRSSSAVLVSSQSTNREWIYQQQQTVSAEGFNGQSFNPHFPHTTRTRETKTCTDCHISKENDNNAWMAQLTLQGTNFVNFFGRYVYVGEGKHGFEAVAASEREEPQAVIGSYLHSLAYPGAFAEFAKTRTLHEAYPHEGNDIQSLQVRGEYLYTAKGKGGVEVYDIANVDNKAFAERVISAPVSPLGQRFYVRTRDAAWIASPTTLAVDPARRQDPANQEQKIHPLYAYIYVADREEGLILIGAATLLDGDPRNNFLKRAITFNPDGILKGARFVVTAGNYAYVSCDRGVVIIDINRPLSPKVVNTIPMSGAGHIAIQFRYAFVCDRDGLKIVDITNVEHPAAKASVPIAEAKDVYIARTYAYVAAGKQGLAIVDVEKPESPGAPKYFSSGGVLNDVEAVKVGMTNASLFAYVADGRNGLRILQLTSPVKTQGQWGFSPEVQPELIATYKTKGPAIALSKGLDRDRAVDESGNQIAVFGRRGARPFNKQEIERLYLHNGKLYTVSNSPSGGPQ